MTFEISSSINMPSVENGYVRAYFIYDVADAIDLVKANSVSLDALEKAQIELKTVVAAPSFIQFQHPPLSKFLPEIDLDGHRASVRVKLYDYGTITLRISFPYTGNWDGFIELSKTIQQSQLLSAEADRLVKGVINELKPALSKPYEMVSEDYFVFNVQSFSEPVSSSKLLGEYSTEVVRLLLGENRVISEEEQAETLKVRYSYFDDDVVVVQWDAAFVYDNKEGAEAAENILEFANTQLVQYLTYDSRIDFELSEIYKNGIVNQSQNWFVRRKFAEMRAERLRYLLVDIREIADRTTNALKIMGDAFYARLYRGASLRLGLSSWQEQIDKKLDSIEDIYQFVADQSQYAQSEFMEMIVILLIAVEVVIGVIELMKP